MVTEVAAHIEAGFFASWEGYEGKAAGLANMGDGRAGFSAPIVTEAAAAHVEAGVRASWGMVRGRLRARVILRMGGAGSGRMHIFEKQAYCALNHHR